MTLIELARRASFWAAAVMTCVLASGVVEGDENLSLEGLEFFEQHIRPLLVTRCYSCHASRATSVEGELKLDSRSGWFVGGEHGPAIVPGDVEASLLIRSVRYHDSSLQMPPDRRLSNDAIEKLERWVQMGAPDPREETAPNMTGNAISPTSAAAPDPIAGREHWAYRPLAVPSVPSAGSSTWPRNAIDAFVLAKLEEQALTPAPDAELRTLARRTFIQLTGIPPTPNQMAEFLADKREDAFELLVDQLLSSPAYGERWGRHWLDLARYADSNGLDENFLFREAWRYRNRVIELVNADTTYDRFLLEQIAGDLLPYESIEQRDAQRISAGFLLIGPKVLLGIDPNVQRMDIADEQLDTIGKAVLGQTLGCARCHDHKFDPIPTADYYAMAGIFTSTQVMEQRHMLNEQRVMERLVGLGVSGSQLDEEYETFWRNKKELDGRKRSVESSIKQLEKGKVDAFEEFARIHPDAVSQIALDHCAELAERIAGQQQLLEQLSAQLANPPAIPPRAMVPGEADNISDEAIRLAGQADRKGAVIPRGFLQVMTTESSTLPEHASGRLELAQWLTREQCGAGHLTARVMANRIWHHLIGSGIVRTVDNFGIRGEAPSHAELLEFLAHKLIESGWSIKSLVREIVLSRTYAMSSRNDDAGFTIDPNNRFLWRANRRRMDPETLRDGMLQAAGMLDRSPMDSSVNYLGDQATAVGANKNRRRTDFPCRSIYLPVIRNDLPELFDVFDFANPQATTGLRGDTTVPTQGLFMLNDVSVITASRHTAQRLLGEDHENDRARVARLFQLIIQAPVGESELADILAFIENQTDNAATPDAEPMRLQAWTLVCQALYGSSRFQMIE